jgi:hypothetical protein
MQLQNFIDYDDMVLGALLGRCYISMA